jgi:hypothetical protein
VTVDGYFICTSQKAQFICMSQGHNLYIRCRDTIYLYVAAGSIFSVRRKVYILSVRRRGHILSIYYLIISQMTRHLFESIPFHAYLLYCPTYFHLFFFTSLLYFHTNLTHQFFYFATSTSITNLKQFRFLTSSFILSILVHPLFLCPSFSHLEFIFYHNKAHFYYHFSILPF